jgi:hypothetical protein
LFLGTKPASVHHRKIKTGSGNFSRYHEIVNFATLKPFSENPEARRLALVFSVVYFAQGMWYLPNLSITFFLKERLGLSAAETATFFAIAVIPWLIKPVYGLVSDFVPLFGQKRKSYFLLTSGMAVTMGLTLSMRGSYTYWEVAIFFTLMGMGLAFTDVLIDALMVEGPAARPHRAIPGGPVGLNLVRVDSGRGWRGFARSAQISFRYISDRHGFFL